MHRAAARPHNLVHDPGVDRATVAWIESRIGVEVFLRDIGAQLTSRGGRRSEHRPGHRVGLRLRLLAHPRPVLRSGLGSRTAIGVALSADTVSIITMEVIDNAVVLAVPGAMRAGLTDWLFWGSLVLSLIVAFAITVPVNRAPIARGKGHAVVHQYHH